ncbi:MAG: NADH-quinone oxidoreductase subunit C [Elusimicrobia bacterium]|nr:NADH-quinone oxidoreductase subunit C [Elusimicrobiota bacterium]
MGIEEKVSEEFKKAGIIPLKIESPFADEVYIDVKAEDFKKTCIFMHKRFNSPVMAYFACDETATANDGAFIIYCTFESIELKNWLFIRYEIPAGKGEYVSIAKEIYSASLFEREMSEMFGLFPDKSPDKRSLRLHEEVWPKGQFPLRKDFLREIKTSVSASRYVFNRIAGEGIFEIPVGPVHAGIIGPGHFRFSVAGEPVVNLEIRLGFTHRGVEKLFENRSPAECLKLAENICGDSAFSYSLAFCCAVEKVYAVTVSENAEFQRGIFLELERLYNHIADIGGIAVDVGFSFPAAYAAVIKEKILEVNNEIAGSRYLKGINVIGGIKSGIGITQRKYLIDSMEEIEKDFRELKSMLLSSVSFMDRVDGTGILDKNTAEDLGVTGTAGRASGISMDLRADFPGIYLDNDFKIVTQSDGDVLARLNLRINEVEASIGIIKKFLNILGNENSIHSGNTNARAGYGLGYVENWRGPVLFWLDINKGGLIERCKIVDPSFRSWQGLALAVPGNIVPDFPVCNKSFNLSYPGNDL